MISELRQLWHHSCLNALDMLFTESFELKVILLKAIENCTIKVVYLLDGCVCGEGEEETCSHVTVLSSNLSS